jgi:hypothetical protein
VCSTWKGGYTSLTRLAPTLAGPHAAEHWIGLRHKTCDRLRGAQTNKAPRSTVLVCAPRNRDTPALVCAAPSGHIRSSGLFTPAPPLFRTWV